MSWINRLTNFLRPRRLESELEEEIAFHLDARVRDNSAGGMSELEARREASRRFGNRTLIQEETREVNRLGFLEAAWQDLHYALRGCRRNPGFALTAIVSLAFGIGANAALFSVVDTLLLKTLPYKAADRLVYVREFWPHEPAVPGPPNTDFSNWRLKSKLAEEIDAYGGGGDSNLTGVGEPERIAATMVTSGLLEMIGARMALGRNFRQDEDAPGGPQAVILGYRLWQRKFGGSPGIIGKQISLDGITRTIIGVLPSGFAFPDNNFRGDLLVPMQVVIDPDWHNLRSFRLLRVMARVRPGVSPAALQAEFAAILRGTAAFEPPQMVKMRKDMEVRVLPLRDWLTSGVRRMVLILQATVAMLLLIACLNIASLQVARAVVRRKEMALRAAVGAGRGRLIRQLLTESALLGALGGTLGLALGYVSLGQLRAFLPKDLHLADDIHMNVRVLLFIAVIAIAAGILVGIAPALAASRTDLHDAIKEGRSSPSRQRLHGALVIAEIAMATVLLVGCSLFVRTFVRLASANPGFRPDGVLTLQVALPGRKYPDAASARRFYEQLHDRVQAIPGTESAAISGGLPIVGTRSAAGVSIEGATPVPLGGRPSVPVAGISRDYFHALGIPLLRGRAFTNADGNGPLATIVNQAFAERFFPGQDALGRRIEFGSRQGHWRTIVGIAGNVTQHAWGEMDPYIIYWPLSEQFNGGEQQPFLILKSAQVPPDRLVSVATAAVHEIDPNLPVFDIATMNERLGASLSAPRANMILMTVFAVLALVLAAIGIFALTAYYVSQRTHELGIRVALGATRGSVLRMIVRRGARFTAAGLILGIAGATVLMRAIGSLLEGVQSNDPVAVATAALLFGMVAAVACLSPAVRVLHIDPMVTLREE